MIPEKDDMVTASNKTYPNFSYNKNRQLADDVMKINAGKMDQAFDVHYGM